MERLPAIFLVLVLALLVFRTAPSAAQAGDSGGARSQSILPIDPAEIEQLRPLIARGAVILPRYIDWREASRCTIYVRVHAPLAIVRRAIVTPEEYTLVVPALSGVEVLSRRERWVAFRFHARVAVFDITADATLHVVNDRRIDVSVQSAVTGPSGSRWELFPDGPTDTIVALTMWTDPWQAMPLLRQFVGTSGYAASSASITAETVLALGVKRRAEILAGARLPLRPARGEVARPDLTPPPPGPWLEMLPRVNILVIDLDPEGSLRQITAMGWTPASSATVIHRLLGVEQYGVFWGWMRDVSTISRTPTEVRFRLRLGAPFAPAQGELVSRVEPGGATAWLEGQTGDFAGERHRWDFIPAPQGGTYVMYTSGSEIAHAGFFHRQVMDRDVWAAAGASAYWKAVVLRYGLWGLL